MGKNAPVPSTKAYISRHNTAASHTSTTGFRSSSFTSPMQGFLGWPVPPRGDSRTQAPSICGSAFPHLLLQALFSFSRRMEKGVVEEAHLHLKLSGQEATYHWLSFHRQAPVTWPLLNARGTGRCPCWVVQGWAAASQLLHYGGSMNLLGLAGYLCCGLTWAGGCAGCSQVGEEARWLRQRVGGGGSWGQR